MTSPSRKFELAPSTETLARRREIQLLINIAEPDPEYQPGVVTDEASLVDAVSTPVLEITRRFDAYFQIHLELNLLLPLWRLVDAIKLMRPAWPDDSELN